MVKKLIAKLCYTKKVNPSCSNSNLNYKTLHFRYTLSVSGIFLNKMVNSFKEIGRYTSVIFDFCAHKSKIPDVWAATVNLIYFSNKFQNIGRFISVSAVRKVEHN